MRYLVRVLMFSTILYRSLDLSFNNIRRIENIHMLTCISELFLVNNKIVEIGNLGSLVNLHMLELGSNRIRVSMYVATGCISSNR